MYQESAIIQIVYSLIETKVIIFHKNIWNLIRNISNLHSSLKMIICQWISIIIEGMFYKIQKFILLIS